MALTKLTTSLAIIAALDDEPSLTAAQLKAKFDEAGGLIKDYINDTLTEEIDDAIPPVVDALTSTSATSALSANQGKVINDALGAMIGTVYPVGSIYMSVVPANPATLFGVGTWVAWGAGRVPVGIDGTQTEFDTAEETGGEKTHTLTIGEMPAHIHASAILGEAGCLNDVSGTGSNMSGRSVPSYNVTTQKQVITSSAGIDLAHNNLQPYITCYMWKRTA